MFRYPLKCLVNIFQLYISNEYWKMTYGPIRWHEGVYTATNYAKQFLRIQEAKCFRFYRNLEKPI